ncbi:MAG: protein-glutamate O-methyltransferase [Hydrogenobaculum sp.]|nr:MAG: protein-glutamate O-methyltransferase [Hydrogenobaculum sp.]PMP89625.1 MAG: protein-glutamate O-methyltransferase [Hydrogenobaculum sp.]
MIGVVGFPILSKSYKPSNQRSIQTQQEINQLKAIDQDVRAHEMAHKIAGGDLTGPVNYKYVVGPNGKKYAVGGDVSIDVSPGPTPQDTIRKMERVIKAALAPVDPSAQDRAVAAQAQMMLEQAQIELQKEGSNISVYA